MDGDNLTESLFLITQYLLTEKLKSYDKKERLSYIYEIDNTLTSQKYIGSSSKNDLDIRFAEHIRSIDEDPGKLYKFVRETEAILTMKCIRTIKIKFKIELLLLEDYMIYKHDVIKNGFNSRYNTMIPNFIFNKKLNPIEKFGEIYEYINNTIDELLIYYDVLESIIDKVRNLYKDDKLSILPDAWININKKITVYNPFIDTINEKCDDGLDLNIIAVYGFYWSDTKETLVYGVRGGLNKLLAQYDFYLNKNKLITKIIEFGLNNINVYPLQYIYAPYSQRNEQLDKYYRILTNNFKKYIDQFFYNKFVFLEFLYTPDQIKKMISISDSKDNLMMFYSSISLKKIEDDEKINKEYTSIIKEKEIIDIKRKKKKQKIMAKRDYRKKKRIEKIEAEELINRKIIENIKLEESIKRILDNMNKIENNIKLCNHDNIEHDMCNTKNKIVKKRNIFVCTK